MKKLIITDLDGTLLTDQKEISLYTAQTLRACQARGIPVAFATARARRVALGFSAAFEPDYILANGGASLYDRDGLLEEIAVPAAAADALTAQLLALPEVTCLSVEARETQYTTYQGAPWGKPWENWNAVYNDFRTPLGLDSPKISVECAAPEHVRALLEAYPELYYCANSGEAWGQIYQQGAEKSLAVRRLARMLGVELRDTIAFGDDFNDIEMLRACGIGVAMENAAPQVKAVADAICASNNNDGAARWLAENIL